MRRRELLAGMGGATFSALAGCACGETWTGVGFAVEPTALDRTGDGWRVGAGVEVMFGYGREGTGVFGTALAAFDDEGRVVGTTRLGDLTWTAVPEADRTKGECGTHGRLRQHATVEIDDFPRWVGIQYDRATTNYTEPREIARYRGDPGSKTGATVNGYEPVAVNDLNPSHHRPATTPPIEDLTFRPGELTCDPAADPEIEHTRVNTALLIAEYARQLPAPHYRATLAGYSYGEVLRFDIGLAPRPLLRRADCTAMSYEVSTQYGDLGPEPRAVELRHLDRLGEVVETVREPIHETTTSRTKSRSETFTG